MQKTIATHAAEVEMAAFLANAVNGEARVGAAFRGQADNGWDDDYGAHLAAERDEAWTVLPENLRASLPTSDVQAGGLLARGTFLNFQGTAEALIVEGTLSGKTTLIYAARGTDSDDAFAAIAGQSFTPAGLSLHYALHRPWIEAALTYVNDAANGIEQMVFAGHSLGGAMADMFTAFDAPSVDVDMLVVSLGSAGLAPGLFEGPDAFGAPFDPDFVGTGDGITLTATPDYINLAHSEDPVRFPFTSNAVNVQPLRTNIHPDSPFGAVDLQHQPNTGTSLTSFGLEHDPGRYHETAALIAADPALRFVGDAPSSVVMGSGASETGATSLTGTGAVDYMLGLAGDDALAGQGGRDILSGGDGADTLDGGAGADRMIGGAGDDLFIFDDAGDRATEASGGGTDTIRASADVTLSGAEIERVVLEGTGALRVIGDGGDTEIVGNSGANVILGGGGADRVSGGGGGDTFAFLRGRTDGAMDILDFEDDDRLALDDRLFGSGTAAVEPRAITEAQVRAAVREGTVLYSRRDGELSVDLDGRNGDDDPILLARIEGGAILDEGNVFLF